VGVDADGRLDLVVASGGAITVMLGEGDGRFRSTPSGPIALPTPCTELASSDFNGDGKLDLALANHDTYDVMLLLGDGAGGFAPAPSSPVAMKHGGSPHTHGLLAGDLNGDGTPDLVSMNSDDHDVSLAFADGAGGFARGDSSYAVARNPYPGAIGDLDGDGDLDIVATSVARPADASTGALTVLLGDGRGGFRTSSIALRTNAPGFVAIADVNNDGKLDLAATHLESRELTILIGDGAGIFVETAASPFDLGHATWQFAAVDVDGDGNVDVAAAAGDGVRVMLGDGRGEFTPAPGSPFATGQGAWQLAAGDVNGDGKPDVVTSNLEARGVSVLLAQ
jgi:hypothetical protein